MESTARYRNADNTEEVAIYRDEGGSSPIVEETWFRFVVASKRYDLGHDQVDSVDELEEQVEEAKANGDTILPVYLEDHGRVGVSVGTGEWERNFGAIFISEAGCKEFGIPSGSEIDQVRAAIADYNEWLAGEVYGYIRYEIKRCDLGHEHATATDDSCWGFIGGDYVDLLSDAGVSTADGWTELES